MTVTNAMRGRTGFVSASKRGREGVEGKEFRIEEFEQSEIGVGGRPPGHFMQRGFDVFKPPIDSVHSIRKPFRHGIGQTSDPIAPLSNREYNPRDEPDNLGQGSARWLSW